VFPADDDNAGIGHVPSAGAVSIEIVADRGSFWNTYILIEDGAAHFGVAPNVAVVHDDAAFHQRAGVDAHATAENRLADESAGKDAAARNDAVERLAAALLFIEDKFGGRIGIAGAADRPLAIVKVELGLDVVQIHVGFVIGLDGSDIAPVRHGVFRLAGDAVGLEIVSIDGGLVGKLGKNVHAEVVMAAGLFGVVLEAGREE